MGVVVVVLDERLPAPRLGPWVVERLSRLGVTDVSLVAGGTGSALVLSGWSFDGPAHEQRIRDLVAPGADVTVLHGVADTVLRPPHTALVDNPTVKGRNP